MKDREIRIVDWPVGSPLTHVSDFLGIKQPEGLAKIARAGEPGCHLRVSNCLDIFVANGVKDATYSGVTGWSRWNERASDASRVKVISEDAVRAIHVAIVNGLRWVYPVDYRIGGEPRPYAESGERVAHAEYV